MSDPTPAAGTGITAAWIEEMGREDDLIVRYGRLSDLIVEGRPTQSDFTTEVTVEAAIFDTGRPVLLVAPEPRGGIGETVAIFWNGSAQAARAVGGALPLLSRAKAVHVLWVGEARGPETAHKGLPDGASWQLALFSPNRAGVRWTPARTTGRGACP